MSILVINVKLKYPHWFLQYGVKITLLTSCRDTFYIEVLPADQKPKGGSLFFWQLNFYCN